jgi:hypothetical protein
MCMRYTVEAIGPVAVDLFSRVIGFDKVLRVGRSVWHDDVPIWKDSRHILYGSRLEN